MESYEPISPPQSYQDKQQEAREQQQPQRREADQPEMRCVGLVYLHKKWAYSHLFIFTLHCLSML